MNSVQDLISTNCGEFAFSLSEQERAFFVLYHQKRISKTAFTWIMHQLWEFSSCSVDSQFETDKSTFIEF